MKNISKAAITAAVLLATPIAFACDYPSRPDSLPNGATASKEEMIAGVKAINAYQAAMDEYLTCIEADEVVATQALDESDTEALEQKKKMFTKKYDAAVDEQTLVVEEFNAQIRAYKSNNE